MCCQFEEMGRFCSMCKMIDQGKIVWYLQLKLMKDNIVLVY